MLTQIYVVIWRHQATMSSTNPIVSDNIDAETPVNFENDRTNYENISCSFAISGDLAPFSLTKINFDPSMDKACNELLIHSQTSTAASFMFGNQ